jgi:hypothetical protein
MSRVEVAVVGAGPYGLSVGAHLRAAGISHRVFGPALQTWREHMPNGMVLKSDGFASNLSDPRNAFTLARFCETSGIPYDDTQIPVSLETFTAYGLAFQRRMVPDLDEHEITGVETVPEGYRLRVGDGSTILARSVVLAVGITHFAHVPPPLTRLPRGRLSHSSDVKEPERWRGRNVTIVGAGASAIDLAVLLHEAGADVTLVARRPRLKFAGPPPPGGRSLWDSLRHPRSPIGPGWRSRLYCDAPWLFHRLPESLRLHIVREHLGPGAGYPMKDRFVGRVRTLLGCDIDHAEMEHERVRLVLRAGRSLTNHRTEHVIAATGYEVDVRRLGFLSPDLRARLRCVRHAPVLSAGFESSVPGLFFVGAASVDSFGPMMRFACGADWTARRLGRELAARASRRPAAGAESDDTYVPSESSRRW